MKRYRMTPEAVRDLEEIADFFLGDSASIARRLFDRIEAKCQTLAEMPGIGRSRNELAPGLFSSLVGKYVIFYRPDEEGVEIVRILHGARDLPGLFE